MSSGEFVSRFNRPIYALLKLYMNIPRSVRSGIRRALKFLLGFEMPLNMYLYSLYLAPGDAPRRYVEMTPWPSLDPRPRDVSAEAEVRVVLHLHYPELWSEFEAILKTMPGHWGLIATLTPEAAAVEDSIRRAFPGASVYVLENRGRDIGPFFELLHLGVLDGARVICKLHGKRSLSEQRPEIGGELWRRFAVSILINNAERVLELFRERPDLGLVGPQHLLFPNKRYPDRAAWGGVKRNVEMLLKRLQLAPPAVEFFAGSMFWISGQALAALRGLRLRQAEFEDESSHTEESLAHAGERIFIPAARSVGLTIGTIPVSEGEISGSARSVANTSPEDRENSMGQSAAWNH